MTPSVSILQISDLHREHSSPIRNDVLLSSLQNDRDRYVLGRDGPAIRPPDIIVVSGDVIRGVVPGIVDYEAQLAGQYEEAVDFLNALVQRLLAGDRNHLVLVPGNHDVSACHFLNSLKPLEVVNDSKKEILSQLFHPGSRLRWSWQDLGLFKVIDEEFYAQRLAPFASFYAEFYQDKRTFNLDPANQVEVFDYPNFNLAIVGFSSCHENDFFNKQGAIHPGCIADASLSLRDPRFNDRLRVAVWHHNTEGSPTQMDYMDAGILQNLIDSGFGVGFHGHQHHPHCFDTRFRFGGDTRISVISSGTLCGSASPRFGRAYNIVELDVERQIGRLHVREMLNDDLERPIWGCRPLPPDTTPYLDFSFDPPPTSTVEPSLATTTLLKAQYLYDAGEHAETAELLLPLAATDDLARRLLLDCLGQLNDSTRIAVYFDPPQSDTEAIYLMEALWEIRDTDRLNVLVNLPIVAKSNDPSVIETREKYKARLAR